MLIGLHGLAGSGKDQAFTYMAEWAASRKLLVRRGAFGDLVKLSGIRALGFEGTDDECLCEANRLKRPGWEVIVRDPAGIEHVISGREYWQLYGDQAHRQIFGEDFWIDKVMWDHDRLRWDLYVITDVRYDNEALAARRRGGLIWHIDRPDTPGTPDHDSERGLSTNLVDRVIANDKGLRTLRKRLHRQLKTLDKQGIWNRS